MKNTLLCIVMIASFSLVGCANQAAFVNENQFETNVGAQVTPNPTPYSSALECIGNDARNDSLDPIWVSVGNIKDMTGRFSSEDGGYELTQGANLMVTSALGRIGAPVQLTERIDTSVFKFEADLAEQKMLGDNETKTINTKNGKKSVNWRLLKSGQVIGSEYYITGGLTEVNYNIFSGGSEAYVAGIGGGARVFAMSVAIDLRLVDTESLVIVDSVTLQKQIYGYETKAGVFKFFGNRLFDINAGEKSLEPLQLGVRTVLEVGVAKLMGGALNVFSNKCINEAEEQFIEEVQKENELQRSKMMESLETTT